MHISWGNDVVPKYRLYYKTDGIGWTKVCDTTMNGGDHTNLKTGKTYTYTLRILSADSKRYLSGFDPIGVSTKYLATPKISKAEYTYDGIKLHGIRLQVQKNIVSIIKTEQVGTSWLTLQAQVFLTGELYQEN